ncbi:MAG: hypothetical protein AAFP16_18355 [Pseudomonadota bacterium]
MAAENGKRSAALTMVVAALCGAAAGGLLGVLALPDFAAALAIGGAMTAAAVGAAFFLFAGEGQ